ncbi:low quality protein:, partial [Lynx pardinus]
MDHRKIEHFSCSVIFIMAISKAFELELVAALSHRELACPSREIPALRDDCNWSQEEPSIHHWSFQFVLSIGIQDSKELNRTCCLNGGTYMLGSFFACPPPSMAGTVSMIHTKTTVSLCPHDTWLSKRHSMCKCWCGQLHCFPQTFLPGCEAHVMDEHFLVSRTPELISIFGHHFFASWHLPCYTKLL